MSLGVSCIWGCGRATNRKRCRWEGGKPFQALSSGEWLWPWGGEWHQWNRWNIMLCPLKLFFFWFIFLFLNFHIAVGCKSNILKFWLRNFKESALYWNRISVTWECPWILTVAALCVCVDWLQAWHQKEICCSCQKTLHQNVMFHLNYYFQLTSELGCCHCVNKKLLQQLVILP